MLWEELMRSQNKQLGADPLGADQGENLKACNGQFTQAQVCHLDLTELFVSYNDAYLTDQIPRPITRFLPFLSCDHYLRPNNSVIAPVLRESKSNLNRSVVLGIDQLHAPLRLLDG